MISVREIAFTSSELDQPVALAATNPVSGHTGRVKLPLLIVASFQHSLLLTQSLATTCSSELPTVAASNPVTRGDFTRCYFNPVLTVSQSANMPKLRGLVSKLILLACAEMVMEALHLFMAMW